jgi:hypothetical protein
MKLKFLEVFKVGEHPISETESLNFSEEMLNASIAAYDPKLHEAPLVIGHPKNDDPAYGWVKNAKLIDGKFVTENDQVNPEFAELVSSGAFKKISASFYPIGSKYSPRPEVLYLKHIGFLGAKPPAIKGLAGIECQHAFAEDEELVTIEFGEINFMDWDDMQQAMQWQRLRDWMISKFNLETADGVIPVDFIDSLKISAAQDDMVYATKPEMQMDYSEGKTVDLAKKEASLNAREADIAKREAKLKEHEFAEWFDGVVSAGKAYPHEKEKAVAALMSLSSISQPIEFSEGGETKSQTLLETYKASFENRPKLIEFSELPTGDTSLPASDSEEYALLIRERVAKAKSEGRSISFSEAQDLVEAGK